MNKNLVAKELRRIADELDDMYKDYNGPYSVNLDLFREIQKTLVGWKPGPQFSPFRKDNDGALVANDIETGELQDCPYDEKPSGRKDIFPRIFIEPDLIALQLADWDLVYEIPLGDCHSIQDVKQEIAKLINAIDTVPYIKKQYGYRQQNS